jgi:Domain of unknown function (DUF4345)
MPDLFIKGRDMMTKAAQFIVGIQGIMALAVALLLWFAMDKVVGQLGISPTDITGRATVRADMAGLFAGIGVMALLAAWQKSPAWANAVLVLMAAALAGRGATIVMDGIGPMTWPPMIIEAVSILILSWARSVWITASA